MSTTKPKVGQTWTFGVGGRPDMITRISRGAVGKWSYSHGQFVPPKGKHAAMWISWKSGFSSITVKALWKDWVFIS